MQSALTWCPLHKSRIYDSKASHYPRMPYTPTMSWLPEELIEFETRLAERFNAGEIRYPVHLSDGSEEPLIEIFSKIKKNDWVFASWRSHYQCLLKGVPPDELEAAVLNGRSIALCFPEYNLFSSAIVGGQISIATGVAMGLKRSLSDAWVWCFLGDMTSETGVAQSAVRYAFNHQLPITFVIEDNGISVCTETREVWGTQLLRYQDNPYPNQISYTYKSKYPHAGAGKRVQF